MAATALYDLTCIFPLDVIRAVEEEAVRDAEHVAVFLHALGLIAVPDRPLLSAPGFLAAPRSWFAGAVLGREGDYGPLARWTRLRSPDACGCISVPLPIR